MRNLIWSGLVMMLLLSGCGWSGDATRLNDITPLTSITITVDYSTIAADYSTIAQGTSVKLTAKGNFSGYFSSDISDQVTWTSSTPAVADFMTTTSPSRVTGLTPGSTVLTATMKGVSATFNLTVSSATISTVTVTPVNQTVPAGTAEQFTATGKFSDGTTQDITFDATWASSDTSVASLSYSDALNKEVAATQAVNANTTITITASFTFDGAVASNPTSLTVTPPVLQSIAVSIPNTATNNTTPITSALSLSTVTFTAIGTYSDTSTKNITSQVAWASSNTGAVSAPNASGVATTTATQGTSTITATLGSINGQTNLTVTGGNLVSISLPTMTLIRGNAGFISATGTFSNGSTRDITSALTWVVADSTLATIPTPTSNLLLVTASTQRTGNPTITATAPAPPGLIGISAKTPLSITTQTVTGLSISPASTSRPLADLTAGASTHLIATATLSDGSTQDVTATTTWISSAPTIATVGAVGPAGIRITGPPTGGTATITATFGVLTSTAGVTFKPRTLSFTIVPSGTVSVTAGNQTNFTVTATYTDTTTTDLTTDVVWATGDGNIAVLPDSLNQPGLVVGVSSGTTNLTAAFNGQTSTVTLKVP